MKRPKEPATNSAEWMRVYTWRAHKILTAALNGKGEGQRAWLALPKGEAERARYLALRRAAEQVLAYVDDCEQKGDLNPIDMMNQFAILKDIWSQWRERRAAPLWDKYRKRGSAISSNRQRANEERRARANDAALAEFRAWSNAPRRRVALEGLSEPEQLAKYLKLGRPKQSVRRRLKSLVSPK